MELLDKEKAYYDGLYNLCALYYDVKYAIIMTEEFDNENKLYIAPLNQLRCALDHVFNGLKDVNDINRSSYELKEAKEHIQRAGYDAFQSLVTQFGIHIVEVMNKYDNETISAVFLQYYQEIKPALTECQGEVAALRSNVSVDANQSFEEYLAIIKKMKKLRDKVDVMIPSLEEYQKKQKDRARKRIILEVVCGIGIAVVSGLITWFLTYK